MPRGFPSGWTPFLAAAMIVACFAMLGAVPARAQDDNIAPPPPPPGDDAAAPEDVRPPQTEPPAQPPDQQTFEQSLSPYGQWIDTDYGWTFASTVPWGWAVFHYGRWGFGPELGWFWVPGFTWAPAWVGWRSYSGFACWSPLAPRGFVLHGRWPGGGGRARRCHAAVGRQLPRRLPIRRRAPERVASLDASQQRLPRRQRLSRWRLPKQRRQHLPKRWRLPKQRRQHLPKRWRLPRRRSLSRRRLPRFRPPLSAIPRSPRLQTLLRSQT